MTHAEYVKSDLHQMRMTLAATSFEVIETRCDLIRRYIEDGHLDGAEHLAASLEENLKSAMNNLHEASHAVDRAIQRSRRKVVQ